MNNKYNVYLQSVSVIFPNSFRSNLIYCVKKQVQIESDIHYSLTNSKSTVELRFFRWILIYVKKQIQIELDIHFRIHSNSKSVAPIYKYAVLITNLLS